MIGVGVWFSDIIAIYGFNSIAVVFRVSLSPFLTHCKDG